MRNGTPALRCPWRRAWPHAATLPEHSSVGHQVTTLAASRQRPVPSPTMAPRLDPQPVPLAVVAVAAASAWPCAAPSRVGGAAWGCCGTLRAACTGGCPPGRGAGDDGAACMHGSMEMGSLKGSGFRQVALQHASSCFHAGARCPSLYRWRSLCFQSEACCCCCCRWRVR